MPSSGYTAVVFTANEQPTTAKWNLLGANDSAFNLGTGLEDSVILNRHIAAAVLARNKIDWSTFTNNMKSAINGSSPTLSNTAQNLSGCGLTLSFTVSAACKALVTISLGISSQSDFEYRPIIYLNGTLYSQLTPSAGAGNASNRSYMRGFPFVVSLPSGANTVSAGVELTSSTSPQLAIGGGAIAAIVLGDVTA